MRLVTFFACLYLAHTSPAEAQLRGNSSNSFEENDLLSNDKQQLFDLAIEAAEAGEVDVAIRALERILALDPSLSSVRAELSILYAKSGNLILAETYINQVITAEDAPAQYMSQLKTLQQEIGHALEPNKFRIHLGTGIRRDSNATGGPKEVANLITGQPEPGTALAVSAAFAFERDLGFQDGRRFGANLNLQLLEYFEEEPNDIGFGRIELNTNFPNVDRDMYIEPSLYFSMLHLDGANFRRVYGINARTNFKIHETQSIETSIYAEKHKFLAIQDAPNATERDGSKLGVSIQYSRPLSEKFRVDVGAGVASYDAVMDYESFDEAFLQLGLASGPVQTNSWMRGLKYGFNFGYIIKDFLSQNPGVPSNDPRLDKRTYLEAFADYPFDTQSSMSVSLEWTDNTSNIETETFENLGLFVGFNRAF